MDLPPVKDHAELGLSDHVRFMPENEGLQTLNYARSKKGILMLAQGEGSDPTPDFISQAAKKALSDGETFYTPSRGMFELRQEISRYYERIYGADVAVDRIVVTPSGSTANFIGQMSILNPGDEVVIVSPVWQNLLGAVYLRGAHPFEVPLDQDVEGRWSLNMDKLEAAITPKTKAIFINSPNNPTGWVMPQKQVEQALDLARRYDIWLVSDEVYGRCVYDGGMAPSFVNIARPDDKLLVINSFSKAWAMTGWRLGWLVMPEGLQGIYDRLMRYVTLGTPSFIQRAGIVALRNGEEFIHSQIALWRSNADLLEKELDDCPNLTLARPESSFYAFLKLPEGQCCLQAARDLIDQERLALMPGMTFGKETNGYLRLCFAVNSPTLKDAVMRLKRYLNGNM